MKLPEELNLKLEELSNKYKEKELKEAYAGISDRYMNEKRTGNLPVLFFDYSSVPIAIF